AGWLTKHSSAALPKCLWSATATRYFKSRKFIVITITYQLGSNKRSFHFGNIFILMIWANNIRKILLYLDKYYFNNQENGGWGEIRTHGRDEPTPVFKTGALNHSATHPTIRKHC